MAILRCDLTHSNRSYEQDGGSVIDGGTKVKNKTTGMLAGMAFATRLAYFSERDMLPA